MKVLKLADYSKEYLDCLEVIIKDNENGDGYAYFYDAYDFVEVFLYKHRFNIDLVDLDNFFDSLNDQIDNANVGTADNLSEALDIFNSYWFSDLTIDNVDMHIFESFHEVYDYYKKLPDKTIFFYQVHSEQ